VSPPPRSSRPEPPHLQAAPQTGPTPQWTKAFEKRWKKQVANHVHVLTNTLVARQQGAEQNQLRQHLDLTQTCTELARQITAIQNRETEALELTEAQEATLREADRQIALLTEQVERVQRREVQLTTLITRLQTHVAALRRIPGDNPEAEPIEAAAAPAAAAQEDAQPDNESKGTQTAPDPTKDV